MNIQLHSTVESLEQLRAGWNDLVARSTANSVFLTWEWLSSWWTAYGSGRELRVLSAWDEDRLVGIAPLYREVQRQYGLRQRVLRFLGDGTHDSDYLDFIAARDRDAEVMAGFARALADTDDWDRLDCNGPAQGAITMEQLQLSATASGWVRQVSNIPCLVLQLPAAWAEYVKTLKPRFRTKVRSSMTFFETQQGAHTDRCTSSEALPQWLDTLFTLHTRRWRSAGQQGVFGLADKRKFYAAISATLKGRDWLAFDRLQWCERTLATQFGMQYNGVYYLLQEGYDPDFEQVRPGVALRGTVMHQCIERGFRAYDFLAGSQSYKTDWGAAPITSTSVRFARTPAKARVAFGLPAMQQRVRERIGAALPESVLAARRRLLATAAPMPAQPIVTRKVRALANLYRLGPLQRAGNRLATRYSFSSRLRGRRPSSCCQILTFHRVNDDADSYLQAMPVATFKSIVEYLSARFHVVSLDELADGAAWQHPFSIAITFDDGYRDNFTNAYPILKQLGIPATIFLATGYVDRCELPWYDQVCLAFKLTEQERIDLSPSNGPAANFSNSRQKVETLQAVLWWLRHLTEQERARALTDVFSQLHVSGRLNLPNQMLSWEEARQMLDGKITFGAHTVNHPALGNLSRKRLEEEIFGSKKFVETKLRRAVRHFAYPFGAQGDLSELARQVVAEAGFATAVTTRAGLNTPANDFLMLHRGAPWEQEISAFAFKFDWFRLTCPMARNEGPASAEAKSGVANAFPGSVL